MMRDYMNVVSNGKVKLAFMAWSSFLIMSSCEANADNRSAPKYMESCSKAEFVKRTTRVAEVPPSEVPEKPVLADSSIELQTVQKILSPCLDYVSSFTASKFKLSTGIEFIVGDSDTLIVMNSNIESTGLGATRRRNDVRLLQGVRLGSAHGGRIVDLILRRSEEEWTVARYESSPTSIKETTLLRSVHPIRSLGWFGDVHGVQGGAFILQEAEGELIAYTYLMPVSSP